MLAADLLQLQTNPTSLCGTQAGAGNPPVAGGRRFSAWQSWNTFANRRDIPLLPSGKAGLWTIAAADCGLADGIYHYWFSVENTAPNLPAQPILCSDPFSTTVDWRLLSLNLPAGFDPEDDLQPASVVRWQNGRLSPVDPHSLGEMPSFPNDPTPDTLPPNNQLVIYELPTTTWSPSRTARENRIARGGDSFKDVLALVDENQTGADFAGLAVLAAGRIVSERSRRERARIVAAR